MQMCCFMGKDQSNECYLKRGTVDLDNPLQIIWNQIVIISSKVNRMVRKHVDATGDLLVTTVRYFKACLHGDADEHDFIRPFNTLNVVIWLKTNEYK